MLPAYPEFFDQNIMFSKKKKKSIFHVIVFLQQGRHSTEAFLRNYVIKNNPPVKSITVSKTEINRTVMVEDNANKKDSKTVDQDMQNRKSTESFAFNNQISPGPIVEPTADVNGYVAIKRKTTTFTLNL